MSSPVAGRSATVKDAEMAVEQRRVDSAYARLAEMRAEAQEMIKEGYRQALAGTKGSLVDRDAMVYQAALRAQALDAADDGLVFGRLDLAGGETRYIGRIGVRTREQEPMVIDWRAPAAEAFYRATPEDRRGVVRRRVLHTRGRTVVDLEDDLLDPSAADSLTIVGDGAFLASLARTREGTMRDIVATIQREQDEVIRAPADGTVLVRGAPGTGKTAVALHRVAYLLFRHRRRFGSRGVLVVGPNRRFTSYIARVLPSLGEDSAVLRSLGDLVPGVSATVHDPPELARIKGSQAMAAVLRRAVADHPPGAPDELRVVHAGVVVRLDRKTLDRLRTRLHRRSAGGVNAARRRVAETLLEELWRRYVEVGGPDHDPGAQMQGELALWEGLLAESGLEALDGRRSTVRTRTGREAFEANVRQQRAFTDFLSAWWPIRTPLEVLRSLGDRDRMRRAAGRDLPRPDADRLAAAWAEALSGERPVLGYQDIALLDEIDALLGPPPRPSRASSAEEDPYAAGARAVLTGEELAEGDEEAGLREVTSVIERLERARRVDDETEEDARPEYGHIVVDEAQDLSPMQWRMLGRRGRQATWTIVTDPAQSAWEDLEEARAAMEAAISGPSSRRRRGRARPRYEYELTTNYRNTTEIAEVSARVLELALPGARPARAVRGSGVRPVIRLVPEEAMHAAAREAVRTLLEQVEGTIGVLVPLPDGERWTARDHAALAAGLPERVQVLDVLEAKGLEFDAAVICAPETVADQSPRGLRILYVAVSRATQRLTVLTADPAWERLLT
ncbi:UvrD-helicase domain-containing protein [Thermomonospora catenispora]|uniref:UvrD-helicase domain-containing protein n=1 Tax=Thermomonospora catenispora TaxID=2493090 RepID=UPI0011238D6F|nr:UvrD-helicase domain-containing protein [Thermomonospora catenispora]TNY34563.1 AAA family ATPase [Thermomonospora catenispora]